MRIYFCKSLYSISYIGAEIGEHSACCRGELLMDFFSLPWGDAIFFASCHGHSFERSQHVFKPNCKEV